MSVCLKQTNLTKQMTPIVEAQKKQLIFLCMFKEMLDQKQCDKVRTLRGSGRQNSKKTGVVQLMRSFAFPNFCHINNDRL